MNIIRLTLLIVTLGGLALLLVQNFSPALPLVFLGMRTQPLPLALWILFSITAGGLSSLLISTLLKFTNYITPEPSTKTSKSKASAPRVNRNYREETIPPPSSSREYVNQTDNTTINEFDEFDDWETDDSQADDWEYTAPRQPQPKTDSEQKTSKTASQSNSVYSYSSQAPKNTGVGKTESVYDADYRVIIPPYQPAESDQSDDDDWSFFEDDDFENDNENPK